MLPRECLKNLAPFKQLRWWPEPLTSTKHWQFVWSTEWSFWINQRQEWRQRMYIVQGSNIFCITHEKDHWTCCTWKWKWCTNIEENVSIFVFIFPYWPRAPPRSRPAVRRPGLPPRQQGHLQQQEAWTSPNPLDETSCKFLLLLLSLLTPSHPLTNLM